MDIKFACTSSQRRRIAYLKDNWIEIEKDKSDVYIVTDTRYDISNPGFEKLDDAIRHGERQLGMY